MGASPDWGVHALGIKAQSTTLLTCLGLLARLVDGLWLCLSPAPWGGGRLPPVALASRR